jgi:hypothetical protein
MDWRRGPAARRPALLGPGFTFCTLGGDCGCARQARSCRAARGGRPIAARVRLCAGLAQPVVVLAIYKHGRYTEEVQATAVGIG